jgi:hypothetical protein
LELRAAREEPFALGVLAGRDRLPYTFIAAVRYAGSASEPTPYVLLTNAGADRPVGGWSVRTGTGAVYTFAPGTTLPAGSCRIGFGAAVEADDSTCPGAVFDAGGADALASRDEGYVLVQDERGDTIDVVGWP